MKNLKSKLMGAIAMLTVASVMMVSVSFAWFTISTAPEVKNISTKVVTNENLEIALATDTSTVPAASATGDTGDSYTWGNMLDIGAALTGKNFDTTLRPATLAAGGDKFQYPTYGNDGRVDKLGDLTAEAFTGNLGVGNLKKDSQIYGFYVDLWLRSNVAGKVTLSTGVNRVESQATTLGGGSTFTAGGTAADSAKKVLAENIHVAFAEVAAGTAGAAKAATTTPSNTTSTFSTAAGNEITLVANEAKLVRMYVYLEGANVTNAAASIDGTDLTGALNIQFTHSGGLDKPMAETIPAVTP